MGLDLCIGNPRRRGEDPDRQYVARWSYSGFHAFRTRLAAAIGITLDNMEGFNSGDWRNPVLGTVPWNTVHDPIKYLLNHSDADGTITPARCKKVAPRLKELVSAWPEGDYDREEALRLAAGMETAVERRLSLVFR